MSAGTDVNIKVTAPGNELAAMVKQVETLKKEVRELKAAFAGVGGDADTALGKVKSGLQRTQAAFEKHNGFFFTSAAQQQQVRNRDLDQFKARTLAANREAEQEARRHAAAMNQIRGGMLRNLGGQTYQPHPAASGRDVTMLVDAKKLEAAWRASSGYIAPGGEGVTGRRAQHEQWLATHNGPLQSSQVSLDKQGVPQFNDGRHRARVAMDQGTDAIGVTVPRSQAAEMQARFGIDYSRGAKGDNALVEQFAQKRAAERAKRKADNKADEEEEKRHIAAMVEGHRRRQLTQKQRAEEDYNSRRNAIIANHADGKLTDEQRLTAEGGIRKMYRDESGMTAERKRAQREEERIRQSDQQAGIRLVEQHATAQERFNVRIARATQLKKDQHISEAVFKREVAAANKELNGQFNSLGSIGGQVAGLAASYMGVQAIIGGITERVARWREETEKLRKASNVAADTLELLRKRFQVQGRMTDAEAKGHATSINAIAQKTALPLEQAYELATSLQTSGFSAKEASGGSLETLAKFMQAQALSGEELNPKEFAQSFAKFLNANELKPDNKNLNKFASFFQSEQVKATMIKIPDLLYAASEASGLKEFGVGAETQAALAAFMSDKKRVRVGETNLREVVRHMRTAAGSPDKVKVLAGIGLKPEDIDMVGEDFYTAMGRFNQASGKLGEAERGVVMDKLFEGANVGTAGTVMRNLDHIKEMEQKGFADKTSLETDAAVMTTGRTASNVRGDNEIKIGQSERGSYADQFGKAFEAVALRKGMSGGAISEQKKWYEYHLASGMTPEAAFARSQGGYNTSVDVRGTVNGRSGETYRPEEFDRFQPENEFRPLTNLMFGPDRRPTRREVEAEFTKNAGGAAEAAEMREVFIKFQEDLKNNTVAVERNTEAIQRKDGGGAPVVPNNKQPVAPRPAEGLSGAMRGDNFKPVPGRMF